MKEFSYLNSGRRLFSDCNFIRKLYECDKDNINLHDAKKAQACLDRAGPEIIETARKCSRIAEAILLWASGVLAYNNVATAIAPKREMISALQIELAEAHEWLSALGVRAERGVDG